MKQEIRTAIYDDARKIEAYRFQGFVKPFPKHFHEHYVIGLVEEGERALVCKNREYSIKAGDLLLFNPGDSHACVQSDGGGLDYRSLTISRAVMLELAEEVTGRKELPRFSPNVVLDGEAACCLRLFHRRVMEGSQGLGREEALLLLIAQLIQRYSQPLEQGLPECRAEVERACAFMEEHYAEHISLDQLCRCTGLSKSTLLRAFGRAKGVTPYSYLENIRIQQARELLRQGVPPVEAALQTGFSDQSHLTNCFGRFLGLTPGAYQEIVCLRKEEL